MEALVKQLEKLSAVFADRRTVIVAILLMLAAFTRMEYALYTAWVVPLAHVILFRPLVESEEKRKRFPKVAFWWLFGTTFCHTIWLGQFVGKWVGVELLGMLAVAFIAFVYGGWGWVAAKLSVKAVEKGWDWLVPILLTLQEVGRTYFPTINFPWTFASDPLIAYPPLVQHAAWVGAFGVSLGIYAFGLAIANPRRPQAMGLLAIPCVFLLISIVTYLLPLPPKVGLRVAAGQLGLDSAFMEPGVFDLTLPSKVQELQAKAESEKADVLLMPEGMIDIGEMPPNPSFPIKTNYATIFGGRRGFNPRYQSAFIFDGSKWQVYDKVRLVAFGEFVPFREVIPYPKGFALPSGDLVPSPVQTQVRLNGSVFGPMICFETLFPDVALRHRLAGAKWFAVMSVDDWYAGTAGVDWLAASCQWRAIENRLPLIRATPLGKTCFINARGEMVAQLPVRATDALVIDL